MNFTIRYDQELNAVVLKTIGPLIVETIPKMIDEEVRLLTEYPQANLIYDQTGSSAEDISSADISSISSKSVRLSECLVNKKMAVVLTDDLSYGLGRMWKSFTEVSVPFEIQLFRSFDAACKWVATL